MSQVLLQFPSRVIGRVAKTNAPTNASLATALGLTTGSSSLGIPSTNVNLNERLSVVITAYSSTVYVKATTYNQAPAVACSSADYDYAIVAGQSLSFSITRGVDLYITSAGDYSAVEFG